MNNINSYLPYVFVINMDKDVARMRIISNSLNKLGLKYSRVSAVNGKELEKNNKITSTCMKYCSNGIKGCAMSHMNLWKYIIDTNIEHALILEDDAEFVDDFNNKFINFYNIVPKDYDILHLGCVFGCNIREDTNAIAYLFEKIISKSPEPKDGYNLLKYLTATHGYIISNKGATKLYNNFTIYTHIDLQISIYMDNNDFIVYSPTKDLIVQKALNFLSNLTDKFPNLLLKQLDKINLFENDHKYVSLGWLLSQTCFKIGWFDINGILILFILLSVLSRYNMYFKIFILIWLIIEIIYAKGTGFQFLILFLAITEFDTIKNYTYSKIKL
jgi:glycosyl transferase family 25